MNGGSSDPVGIQPGPVEMNINLGITPGVPQMVVLTITTQQGAQSYWFAADYAEKLGVMLENAAKRAQLGLIIPNEKGIQL